ncbi:type IV secretory system conjugative DNA transfer family protein [uncultured Sphingomonas sp.]|uniref:type IV secretory system conjugative DNA transfer family protein n=1 Tax=uncultured Sphingomonas sp. TaxID=158754 RepID=UPI0035CAC566
MARSWWGVAADDHGRPGILLSSDHSRSTSTHVAARSLMTPDEIMRMPADQQLLLLQGQDPLMVAKVRYYDGWEFAGLADPA